MKKTVVVSLGGLLALVLAQRLSPQPAPLTRYVSNSDPTCGGQSPCYSTIQAGVTALQAGDTLVLQAGLYDESVTISQKNNTPGTTEAERIFIVADPNAPVGSVVLGSRRPGKCIGSTTVVHIRASQFLTLRGLTIRDASQWALSLAGGQSVRSHAIHLERNRFLNDATMSCRGGIQIGADNTEVVLSNNLIYGNREEGIVLQQGSRGSSGPHLVLSNTIAHNGRTGVHISEGQEVWLLNNLITHNGQRASSPTKDGFGVERRDAKPPESPESTVLLHNVICGNRTGELKGPILVGTDTGNLTPTGSEGPGVSASPGCEQPLVVYTDVAGADGQLNTGDDDLTLADGSPAIDQGVDLRTLDFGVVHSVVEADYFGEEVRPQDGDGNGTAEFDVGAVERGPSGCTAGQVQACYAGPEGTEGIGLCRAGTQTCQGDRTFGACAGQVLPAAEVCGNGTDEDCDGADLPCVANQPPRIVSTPRLTATVGQSYSYDVTAIDPNGDALTFSLTTAPAGMTINPTTGLIQWTPEEEQAGDNPVTVRVQDPSGLFATQSFTITALIPNHAPAITSAPVITANEGQPYAYDVEATDPDTDDTLTFSLTVAPFGMAINSTTGEIQWTPEQVQAGEQAVTVQVRDEGGLFSRQSFMVEVAEANRAPTAVDDAYEAEMGQTLTVPARGILANDTDPNQQDTLTATLVSPPSNGRLDLHADGSFAYTPTVIRDLSESEVMGNLTQLLGNDVSAQASSSFGGFPPERVIDNDLNTSWFTAVNDAANLGTAPFLEVRFAREVTVTEIQMFGNRQFPAGFDFFAGIFQLLDGNGMVLFDSGVVTLPAPDRDVTLPIPDVTGVRRVRFTATADESQDPGFAELRVIGSAIVPPFVPLQAVLKWKWTGSTVEPTFNQVIVTPIVANLTDDNQDGRIDQQDIPDILFVTTNSTGAAPCGDGILRAISGKDGSAVFDVTDPTLRVLVCPAVAVGDLDGDGRPEIVGVQLGRRLVILNHDGTLKQFSQFSPTLSSLGSFSAPSIADLNHDGIPEIIVGATVFSNTGQVLFSRQDAGTSGLSTAVDLDLEGDLEIVNGSQAFRADGSVFYDITSITGSRFTFSAIGNFDDDPYPEIVLVVGNLGVLLLEHDGTVKWGPQPIPGGGSGGPPTVADFDGDGQLEIGVAASSRYAVFDKDGNLKWQATIRDNSSQITGSSVFDFDNDGNAEVVYNDEHKLRIFDGKTGAVLFETLNPTGTIIENPVIADVDNDGHADIVTVRNDILGFATALGVADKQGVFVYTDQDNKWVRTRRIWNQHAYHITNVNEDGTIPQHEQPNWLTPGLNNFRLNAFAPGDDQADRFVYKATDGSLESNDATVFIAVRQPNAPPEITSTPLTTATVGLPYLHAVRASDPDVDDELTFALIAAPAGMTIEPATGLLRWTPTGGQLGGNNVTVRVEDRGGLTDFQIFTVQVPVPVTVPDVVGQTQAAAESAIGAAGLIVGVTSAASSPTVPAGDVLSQNPAAGTSVAPGSAVNLVISTGPPPPGLTLVSITVSPTDPSILTADTQAFSAVGAFSDGSTQNLTDQVTWESTSTAVATISSTGIATGVSTGTTTIRATKDGISGSTTLTVRQRISDSTPPTSTITSPAPNSTITAPTDIIGTATDTNFSSYKLEIAPAGETTFTLLASGTTPSAGGVLGTLDPTVLLNDLYVVRLTVFDLGGNATISEVTVQVDGDLKVGNFTLTFADLNIPLSGIPITVNRTYDSRDKRKGDFGIGWRLDVKTMRIRANRVQGTGWQVNKSGANFGLVSADQHTISLTLPDGRAEEFDLVVTPTSSFLLPLQAVTASYTPRPGTSGTLVPLDNTNLVILDNQPGPVELLDDLTFNPYDPQTFRYTSIDGQEFVIRKTTGVQSIRDPNGNELTFGPNGITHSAGKSVTFTRDAQGRITQLTDPMGHIQSYVYDANGDLINHTDTGGNTTQFSYNSRHDLIKIVDPLGRPVSRNEYDENGRLIAVTDANGNRLTFSHDLSVRQEVVTDRLGRASVFSYDAKGNVLSTTNPLGETTTYTYDARGNTLSTTDPLGNTTTYTYDANDNRTSVTDPLGNTTTFTYDSGGRPLTVTDPLGHTDTFAYDARGNLTSTVNPLGHTLTLTYDADGNALTVTDPLGKTARNDYDATGNRTRLTDVLGNVTTFNHDANGNLLSQADPGGLTTTLTYDAANRIPRIDAGGATRQVVYDAASQVTSVLDATGRQVAVAYDAVGRLAEITSPDGTREVSVTYDAEGNQTSQTDPLGNVTRFAYDAANRLTMITLPDGSTERRAYDAAGRLVRMTNPLNRTSRFEYDAAGRLVRTINPLGEATSRDYDAAGNLVARTDPLGRTTRFEYDAAGTKGPNGGPTSRLVRTVFPDGTIERRTYDNSDRLLSVVDPAGNATTFGYDDVGRLTSVTNALGNVTQYVYNQAGQRTAIIDANGHTTQFTYDTLGRLTQTTYPLGDTQSAAYDPVGRLMKTTNGNGETLQYTYDTRGRLNSLTLPDGAQEAYTFTDDGLIDTVVDARGSITFAYDAATRRLARVTEPDGRYIRYEYDAVGNRTLMAHAISNGAPEEITRYAYDALNRMVEVTDPNGGITRYTYDAAGNRTAILRPNDTTTTFTYDDRNRLTAVVDRDAAGTILASFIYTLDAVGNRLQEQHADGSRVEYDYDATYKVTAERHFNTGGTLIGSMTYSYDAVGNLLARNGSLGNATYTYNANDQLLAGEGVTYDYDDAGNLISATEGTAITTYTYDARGRLVRLQPPTGTATTYTYDSSGIRQSKSGPGGNVNFLIDRANATGFEQVVRESNPTGDTLRSYVYGPRLLAQTAGTATSYHHADGLGSTRLLTNSAGTITDTYDFLAYGALLTRTGASPNAHLFAGEQQDAESDLYYLRARHYDPRVGRFISRDPFAGDAAQPLSLHKYLYAHDNPVNLTDPSGRFVLVELLTSMLIQNGVKQFEGKYKVATFFKKFPEYVGKLSRGLALPLSFMAMADVFTNDLKTAEFFCVVCFAAGSLSEFALTVDISTDGEFDVGAAGLGITTTAVALKYLVRAYVAFGYARTGLALATRQFTFGHGISECPNSLNALACVETDPKAFAPGGENFPPKMKIYWGPKILTRPPLGIDSWAGTMVHEVTHLAHGTKDHRYGCKASIGLALAVPNLAITNADNYSYFVESPFGTCYDWDTSVRR